MTRRFASRSVAALLFLVLALSLFGGVAAQTTPTPVDHASHHTGASTPPSTTADPCAASPAATPGGMGMGMMTGSPAAMPMHEDFDLMFLDMMIPHHEAAVAMAQIALTRGEHQEIRDLAQTIITGQGTELKQMRIFRDQWYPGAPAMPMDQMMTAMSGMMTSGGMMGGMMSTPFPGMAGVMSPAGMAPTMNPAGEARALCDAAGPFDKAFIEMMIPHHESAIAMAEVALKQATHSELRALAQGIVYSQGAEITQMQGWLANWWGAATPAAAVANSSAAIPVDVTLTEFTIAASLTKFEVGQTYRFNVVNAGALPHEFMIMPHMAGMGQMSMAQKDRVALAMIPVDDLPPGAAKSIEVTFSQPADMGALELVCTVQGHYDAGMRLAIEVDG